MNKYLKFALTHFEEVLASGFIVITTALVLMNVFLRYFLNTGLSWSEEVSTSCFVWSVFLGSASAYRRGMHIGVDILVNQLPKMIRNLVKFLVHVVLLVTNGYIFYLSIIFVSLSYKKPTSVLGVSSAWVSGALIVGFGLTTFYSIIHLVECVKKLSKGEEV